ncbi:MAG: hypothetical protein BroJett018_47910 [Chloroflexota bacterium]|nr:addiction module toxin, HicA family [Chloroflexota bacterium]NOG65832.1 addiction module toxin, HicA family [Chloroflexota bacterium]GIK66997.1 MAG: hypothetical protein BroJett018_47910 [Chloroflexota bacterium]
MPTKGEKLLEKLRRSKAGWHAKELKELYESFGFTVVAGKSHDIVKHPDYPQLRYTLPRHAKELPKSYASETLKIIEILLELETNEDSDE